MSDKWKQLIDLIVNEEEDKASELFHEIVIENSREIYENLITSEDLVDEADVDEELSDRDVDDFIDEIEADEEGISEEDDDMEDAADDMADEMDMEEPAEDPEADEDMENRVIELEDEMEALKAEFAALVDADDEEDEEEAEEADESVAFEDADEDVAEDAEEIEEAEEIVEYTEKAPAPKGGADDNAKSTVAKSGKGGIKNASSAEEKGAPAPKAQDMGGTTKPDMKKV